MFTLRIRGRVGVSSFEGGSRSRLEGPAEAPLLTPAARPSDRLRFRSCACADVTDTTDDRVVLPSASDSRGQSASRSSSSSSGGRSWSSASSMSEGIAASRSWSIASTSACSISSSSSSSLSSSYKPPRRLADPLLVTVLVRKVPHVQHCRIHSVARRNAPPTLEHDLPHADDAC